MSRHFVFVAIFIAAALGFFASAGESLLFAQSPAESRWPGSRRGLMAELTPALIERYEQMAAELSKEVPPRDLTVKTVPTQKVKLFRVDPKLIENRFVAELVLKPSGVDPTDTKSVEAFRELVNLDQRSRDGYPQSLRQLGYVHHRYLIQSGGAPWNFDERGRVSDHVKQLVKNCPAELLPDGKVVEYLTSLEFDGAVLLQNRSPVVNGVYQDAVSSWVYTIFAPTADTAEQRARALVRLYDAGFTRTMQRHFLTEGQMALHGARDRSAQIAELSTAIGAEEAKLAQPSEISDDILSQLKAQKVMVAVELAGLSARVKACDAMLADPKKLEISTLQSINDMKIKAEIERLGIKEKLDQINTFIAEGNGRTAAKTQQVTLMQKRQEVERLLSFDVRNLTRNADLFRLYAPFQIPDNQITVGPVEWTE